MRRMLSLIRTLRRRQVFRATGLYVGGVWIVLQVAELVLPIFDAPDWVMKALVSVGIVGAPVAVVLAWVFDISPSGINLENDETDAPVIPVGRSKMDFVVVGILLLALAGSLFGNFAPRQPMNLEEIDPVSILIADFDNLTGDSVFDGALEQALTIAVEESPFITAFDRTSAGRVLAQVYAQANLDASGARLVSAREGIGIVVNGRLDENKGKYEVTVFATDVESGDDLASFSDTARGKSEVLGIIGELARDLRKKLGDVNADIASEGEESFTTVSLEAMHDYVNAQRLARDGIDDQAIDLYRSAVEIDPQFGRAWTGLAVSADKLGQTDAADIAWKKSLQLLEGMTERERYRTAGVYYTLVARNSAKAIENYKTLVEKYPSDDAGYNNLAVAYFFALQFDKALEAGRKVVDIYPKRPMYHANYALYAMYANDFEAALVEAEKTLELNPQYHKAYLPYAVAALVEGDTQAARQAYEQMAETGARGQTLANIGLADMMLWSGDAAAAEAIIIEGMKADEAAGNKRALSKKKTIRAYALLRQGADAEQVDAQLSESLALSSAMSTQVSAALMYLEIGEEQKAKNIAAELGGKLDVQRRAYSKMIDALLSQAKGENIVAIERLQEALALADLWLIRYYLGQFYFQADHYAEAVAEFTLCNERLGEAYSVFLNDTPTFRYTADLAAWLARANEQMTAQH
jgi:tetratricopeptide (TPR) repeat protein